MKLYNLKVHNEQVSFITAVKQGLGRDQGLFFPTSLPKIADINAFLSKSFIMRSTEILNLMIGEELDKNQLHQCVQNAFTFSVPVVPVTSQIAALELFHGPTLAFKDFGARFMAQILSVVSQRQPITILTATSGDTGAAVAHAFYRLPNVQVVILYPQGKISSLQEKLFCTLGDNIHTIAIEGDFDCCQMLVKHAFDDGELVKTVGLNSANSINVSRLFAQICYYFEAVAQIPEILRQQLVISVPSGNFGNLTAGLLAKALGLPIKRFIAATNSNDTVPRYLKTGEWVPQATVATLSNAMDVSQPNNWPRIEALCEQQGWPLQNLGSGSVNDEVTRKGIQELSALGYLSEPHGAVAYSLLKESLQEREYGLFLGTAHPAKFKQSVEEILQQPITLPRALAEREHLPLLSHRMAVDFQALRNFLMTLSH